MIKDTSIKGQVTLKTNIDYLDVKEETTKYELSYTKDYKNFNLKFNRIADGVQVIDLKSSLKVSGDGNHWIWKKNISFKFSLTWPKILGSNEEFKINAELEEKAR